MKYSKRERKKNLDEFLKNDFHILEEEFDPLIEFMSVTDYQFRIKGNDEKGEWWCIDIYPSSGKYCDVSLKNWAEYKNVRKLIKRFLKKGF